MPGNRSLRFSNLPVLKKQLLFPGLVDIVAVTKEGLGKVQWARK
jgi:hypothetical protein